MRKAIEEAKLAESMGEVPVGAVIICDNQIIARAHNLTEHLSDITAHAEILAITAASEFLGSKYRSSRCKGFGIKLSTSCLV